MYNLLEKYSDIFLKKGIFVQYDIMFYVIINVSIVKVKILVWGQNFVCFFNNYLVILINEIKF